MSYFTTEVSARDLLRFPFFALLNDDALAVLARAAYRRSYRSGALLVDEAEAGYSYIVLSRGDVRFFRGAQTGREITLGAARVGEPVDLYGADEAGHRRDHAEATAHHTVVYHFPREHFLRIVAEHPPANSALLALQDRRLAEAHDLVEELALYPAASRLAHALAALGREREDGVVSLTQEQLAARIGARQADVCRALSRFHELTYTARLPGRRGIVVNDPERLAAL